MRSIKELLAIPLTDLTKEEQEYLTKYKNLKKVKHSAGFIRHSPELMKEEDVGK